MEAIRKHNHKARLVQVSTDEVYGEAIRRLLHRNRPTYPSNPYSASKAAADMFVLAYHKTYGLNVSITRCTNNFGPYQFPEKLIPKTIIRALRNLPIPIYGTGTNIRDWIHVQDHCEAIDAVLEKGKAGEVYNVSAGNEISNIEIAKKILAHYGQTRKPDNFRGRPPRSRHKIQLGLIKNQNLRLAGNQNSPFQQALESTVQWYVENEKWWTPFATETILHPTPWKMSGCNETTNHRRKRSFWLKTSRNSSIHRHYEVYSAIVNTKPTFGHPIQLDISDKKIG